MNHGTVLANIRRKAGCSQSRLVSIIGRMSVAGISDIECGRRSLHEITPRELDAIASALALTNEDRDALWEAAAASFAGKTEWGSALLRSRHARKGDTLADG